MSGHTCTDQPTFATGEVRRRGHDLSIPPHQPWTRSRPRYCQAGCGPTRVNGSWDLYNAKDCSGATPPHQFMIRGDGSDISVGQAAGGAAVSWRAGQLQRENQECFDIHRNADGFTLREWWSWSRGGGCGQIHAGEGIW